MAEVLRADDPEAIRRAVDVLRAGEVIALPTDTVYGLGADSRLGPAIKRLYQIKERDRGKAIPLLLAHAEDMIQVASRVPDIAWRLARQFWPGALTMVLPRAAHLLRVLTPNSESVAVRVPAHPTVLRLVALLGAPLATTSANISGEREAVTAEEVQAVLGERVPLILDDGRCPGGVASTVIDVTADPPRILRRGALGDEVEAFLQALQRGS